VYRRADEAVAVNGDAVRSARPRLGMMIGKKNARTSVLRNAVKRRIREQFRLRQAVLPDTQYVVRLSTAIKPKDVPAVIAEWMGALDREVSKFATARGTNAASSKGKVSPAQPASPQVNA
jgi:ribonuclease P protein component